MFNSFVYSYDEASGLLREPVVYATLRNIVQALEIANRDGLDETSPIVQDVIGKYVNFDPNNLIVDAWFTANGVKQYAMELETPWLKYYRGDTSVTPPADDPAERQALADAEVAAFKRRLFVNERAQIVRKIRVTVNDNEYDGDEVAQGRMARTLAVATNQMVSGLQEYLANNLNNLDITAHELLTGLHDHLASIRAAQSLPWMMANNVAATVTPDEIAAALYQSLMELSNSWGFDQQ